MNAHHLTRIAPAWLAPEVPRLIAYAEAHAVPELLLQHWVSRFRNQPARPIDDAALAKLLAMQAEADDQFARRLQNFGEDFAPELTLLLGARADAAAEVERLFRHVQDRHFYLSARERAWLRSVLRTAALRGDAGVDGAMNDIHQATGRDTYLGTSRWGDLAQLDLDRYFTAVVEAGHAGGVRPTVEPAGDNRARWTPNMYFRLRELLAAKNNAVLGWVFAAAGRREPQGLGDLLRFLGLGDDAPFVRACDEALREQPDPLREPYVPDGDAAGAMEHAWGDEMDDPRFEPARPGRGRYRLVFEDSLGKQTIERV